MTKKQVLAIILLLLFVIITRFLFINRVPPSSENIQGLRFLTAISSCLSVLLLFFLVIQIFKNFEIAWFSALAFIFLPLSFTEGRIYSWVSLMTPLLIIFLILIINKRKIIRLAAFPAAVIILFLFKDNLWFFNFDLMQIKTDRILINLFNLVSFNKLFFKNDSFWSGGFREYGMVIPELIPVFFIGLIAFFRNKKILLIIYSLAVLILSSINPFYPECREIGLISIILAIILGLGLSQLYYYYNFFRRNILFRIFTGLYLIIILFGVLNFFHLYFIHYQFRVNQEKLFQQGNF